MLKLFNRKKKDNKGFTLVELVVVIAILAILVGLLAPQYTKYVEKARKSSDASNLENMVRAVEVAIADTNEDTRVTAGTYTIKINNTYTAGSETTEQAGGTSVTSTDGGNQKNAQAAVAEVLGSKWNETVLKSKNWKSDGSNATSPAATIEAVIKVETDGSFSVDYKPNELKKMIGK